MMEQIIRADRSLTGLLPPDWAQLRLAYATTLSAEAITAL
jgi:hypothetical protein